MTYPYDLAISAVPYDVAFVTELSTHLGLRLRTPAVWLGDTAREGDVGERGSPLRAETSRIAVLLHQRLWRHDAMTRLDDLTLRERLRERPGSVRVVTLDDQAVPRWLDDAPRCDLTETGVSGVAEFLADAIMEGGGSVRPGPAAPEPAAPEERKWREGPPPFLAQPRAFSALRRELDALGAELKPRSKAKESETRDDGVELHSLPNRLVLRIDDVGISFSWVAGRLGTVADGRLLVMQWEGVTANARGVGALKSATPVRERVYRGESTGPEDWHWRADSPNGRACSTANLAAEWLAGASIATASALAARVEL